MSILNMNYGGGGSGGGILAGFIDLLVIGGGGNGSSDWAGGGGGGGGFIEKCGIKIDSLNNSCIPVVVGSCGCNSSILGIIAYGGGAGGATCSNGCPGASGGGGSSNSGISNNTVTNGGDYCYCKGFDNTCSYQGYCGGTSRKGSYCGGGGGGAGGVGGNGSCGGGNGGNGGIGKCSCMSGVCCWYSGGGGGSYGGTGGQGGGGSGGNSCNAKYYGGGGGGYGGKGYQGVVILRYKTDGSCGIDSSSTGGCKYTCGDYTIHCFTDTTQTLQFIPVFK